MAGTSYEDYQQEVGNLLSAMQEVLPKLAIVTDYMKDERTKTYYTNLISNFTDVTIATWQHNDLVGKYINAVSSTDRETQQQAIFNSKHKKIYTKKIVDTAQSLPDKIGTASNKLIEAVENTIPDVAAQFLLPTDKKGYVANYRAGVLKQLQEEYGDDLMHIPKKERADAIHKAADRFEANISAYDDLTQYMQGIHQDLLAISQQANALSAPGKVDAITQLRLDMLDVKKDFYHRG